MAKNEGAVREHVDKRDLNRLKVATYACAVVHALLPLVFLSLMSQIVPYPDLEFGRIEVKIFCVAIATLPFYFSSWIHFRSAQAIAGRRDVHLSYFANWIGVLFFPFGTIFSCYSWDVLSRPGVQELYRHTLTGQALAQNANGRMAITAEEAGHVPWHEAIESADDAEETMWKEIEARSGTNSAEELTDGPIRLVSVDADPE